MRGGVWMTMVRVMTRVTAEKIEEPVVALRCVPVARRTPAQLINKTINLYDNTHAAAV